MNNAILLKFSKCILKKNIKKDKFIQNSNVNLTQPRHLKKIITKKLNLKKIIKRKSNINFVSTRILKKIIKQKSNVKFVSTRILKKIIKQKLNVKFVLPRKFKKTLKSEHINKIIDTPINKANNFINKSINKPINKSNNRSNNRLNNRSNNKIDKKIETIKNIKNIENTNLIIIFICHDNKSIESVIKYNYPILVVGNYDISEKYKNIKNIIITRDLKYNIENEPKLLSFTAWYAIIKNELFSSYKYLCLLEYDVKLSNNFENNLNLLCNSNNIVISFIKTNKHFLSDINEIILKNFLAFKNIKININESFNWAATTNHCMTRQNLFDFVDWYYPDYLQIKTNDLKNLSWYHERLFTLYIKSRNIKFNFLNGLIHIQNNSHKILNSN